MKRPTGCNGRAGLSQWIKPMSTKSRSSENSIATRKRQLIADADPGSLSRAQENVYEFVLAGDDHVNVRNTSYDESGHTYTVAVVIRSPIMQALSGACSTERPVVPDGGVELPPITTHYEPAEQGGEKYVRCEGCGREILSELGGRSKLVHPEGCPHADD